MRSERWRRVRALRPSVEMLAARAPQDEVRIHSDRLRGSDRRVLPTSPPAAVLQLLANLASMAFCRSSRSSQPPGQS